MKKVGENLGKGKKTGKILFTVAGFAIGFSNPTWFGISRSMTGATFMSGMYGMSISSTIWSVVAKLNAFGNLDGDYSQDRKSTRLNSSHKHRSRMPSSA